MDVYAAGYRDAAEVLFRRASRSGPGYLLFPLAFAWRHYVELALKRIIAFGRCLDGKQWGFPDRQHGLLDLWTEAKPYIERTDLHVGVSTAKEVANVEANLKELDATDKWSTAFRYSEDRKRNIALPQAPNLNLRVLHEAMVPLANFLDGVAWALGDMVG